MFIGQIAYTYRVGIESVWMMIGWIIGDLMAWQLVHPRVRKESEAMNVATVPALLGTSREGEKRIIIVLGGLMTFVLLGVYAAAQLKAGSTALQTLFGWQPQVGATIGAVIVVLYCFSGGIRASIWTDAAQSIVMILAMATLLIAASFEVGSPTDVWNNLQGQDPELVKWFPSDLKFGFAMYLLGMTFGGFGAIGQPHILVRFMAIRSDRRDPASEMDLLHVVHSILCRQHRRWPLCTSVHAGFAKHSVDGRPHRVAGNRTGDAGNGPTVAAGRADWLDVGGTVFSDDVDSRFTDPCLLWCNYTGHQPSLEELLCRFQTRNTRSHRARIVRCPFCRTGRLLARPDCVVRTWLRTRPSFAASTTRHSAFILDHHTDDDGGNRHSHRMEHIWLRW